MRARAVQCVAYRHGRARSDISSKTCSVRDLSGVSGVPHSGNAEEGGHKGADIHNAAMDPPSNTLIRARNAMQPTPTHLLGGGGGGGGVLSTAWRPPVWVMGLSGSEGLLCVHLSHGRVDPLGHGDLLCMQST
jgi:hypothetical protein